MTHISATAHLKSLLPYSQSRAIQTPPKDNEPRDDHEKRVWRERIHAEDDGTYSGDGRVYIPAMAIKNSLAEAAKFLGVKIPGRGNNNYTKHFEAGVMCIDHIPLAMTRQQVRGEFLFLSASGQRGAGGTRVWRCMPSIDSWEGEAIFHVFDSTINKDTFVHHLKAAGNFIGIGRWRPRNNGCKGRFAVQEVDWQEQG